MSHCEQSLTISLQLDDASFDINYLAYIPKNTQRIVGGIVFLHGAGERGNDVRILKREGLPKLLSSGALNIDFIVLCPQCPRNEYWVSQLGMQIIDEMVKILQNKLQTISITPQKRLHTHSMGMYLTGQSMGAFGVLQYASLHPYSFSAYSAICGGLNPIQKKCVKTLAGIPLWIFHGALDKIVDVSHSDLLVKHIGKYQRMKKNAHSWLRYTLYEQCLHYAPNTEYSDDNQHDAWSQTYSNRELYEWFLAHSPAKHQVINMITATLKKRYIAFIVVLYLF